MKKKILFVCTENANRSQMAEALAQSLGGGIVEAYSAGSNPAGKINARAIASLKELGIDIAHRHSKSLQEVFALAPFDYVVTMGCGDACPWMPARQRIDWDIPDPREMGEKEFRAVRDLILQKVQALLNGLS